MITLACSVLVEQTRQDCGFKQSALEAAGRQYYILCSFDLRPSSHSARGVGKPNFGRWMTSGGQQVGDGFLEDVLTPRRHMA